MSKLVLHATAPTLFSATSSMQNEVGVVSTRGGLPLVVTSSDSDRRVVIGDDLTISQTGQGPAVRSTKPIRFETPVVLGGGLQFEQPQGEPGQPDSLPQATQSAPGLVMLSNDTNLDDDTKAATSGAVAKKLDKAGGTISGDLQVGGTLSGSGTGLTGILVSCMDSSTRPRISRPPNSEDLQLVSMKALSQWLAGIENDGDPGDTNKCPLVKSVHFNPSSQPTLQKIPGKLEAGSFAGVGTLLTMLDASHLSQGLVPLARLAKCDWDGVDTAAPDAASNMGVLQLCDKLDSTSKLQAATADSLRRGLQTCVQRDGDAVIDGNLLLQEGAGPALRGITADGSGLTNLNASNIATGTLVAARLPGAVPEVRNAEDVVTTAATPGIVTISNDASNTSSNTVPTCKALHDKIEGLLALDPGSGVEQTVKGAALWVEGTLHCNNCENLNNIDGSAISQGKIAAEHLPIAATTDDPMKPEDPRALGVVKLTDKHDDPSDVGHSAVSNLALRKALKTCIVRAASAANEVAGELRAQSLGVGPDIATIAMRGGNNLVLGFPTQAVTKDNSIILNDGAVDMVVLGGHPNKGASVSAKMGTASAADACMELARTDDADGMSLRTMGNVEVMGNIVAAGSVTHGGADYAEYMPLAEEVPKVENGEVVGVDATGHIVQTFSRAKMFAVVSSHPALVGGRNAVTAGFPKRPKLMEFPGPTNTQRLQLFNHALLAWQNECKRHENRFTVIAFCGQVPVGGIEGEWSVGDYIVPCETENGGIGSTAVHNPTLEQYVSCIGRILRINEDKQPVMLVKIV